MEYIERSVQTEAVSTTNSSRKSSYDIKASRDSLHSKRKGSTDSRFEVEVRPPVTTNLGRSVSAGDKVKHAIPKVSKRWNHVSIDHSQLVIPAYKSPGPTPAESLPALSAPATAHFDNKNNSFNFPSHPEKMSFSPDQKISPEQDTSSSKSKSSESVAASTIKEESIASDTVTETEETKVLKKEKKESLPTAGSLPGRQIFPSSESLPVATPTGSPSDTTLEEKDPPKIGKRHPVKFLKRAQSFSQVLKKMADKRKKSNDALRDDYNFAIREPLGELALVPLEKLVSIEELQHTSISEEP